MYRKIKIKSFWLALAICSQISCTPAGSFPDTKEFNSPYPEYNGDTLPVNERMWQVYGYSNYPFLTYGDIGCFMDEVYFYPENSFDENSVGTPLNQKAKEAIKKNSWVVTVPNKIRQNADLTKAIEVGLDICQYNLKEFKKKH